MILDLLEVISEAAFALDPDRYIDQVNCQKMPIRIRANDNSEVVLVGWESYLKMFGPLHSKEELSEITEAMRIYEG